MNATARKISAACVVVVLGWLAYYGSFLPLKKSQLFIQTLRTLDRVQSVTEFKELVSKVFEAPSPIGQEELVRNTANSVLSTIQQTENLDVVSQLVDFINMWYKPIIDRGAGMSFEQNLYVLGTMHEFASLRTRNPAHLTASKAYYSQGLKLGPKRPQFLYGMFDVYRMEGNLEGVKSIAKQVLTYWPNDEKIKQGLEDYLEKFEAPQK